MVKSRIQRAFLIGSATIGVIVVLAVVLMALVVVVSFENERRAETCFADFLRLGIGQSDLSDLVKLQQKYGGTLINTPTCGPEHCEYQFAFQNNWLHRLGFAPRIRLVLGVGVENDRVTGRSMWYGMDLGDTPVTHVTEVYTLVTDTIPEEGPPSWQEHHLPGPKDFKIDVQLDSRGHPFHYVVFMNTDAPPDYRKRAYSIDLKCLARIGGCDTGRVLAPFDVPY